MNTMELANRYPEAFQALPEPYQADSCLRFWEDDGTLYAEPLEDQVEILGDWRSRFVERMKRWVRVFT